MNIVIAGSSGLVGTALVSVLRARGDTVRFLVRRQARAPGEFEWDPARGVVPASAFEGTDAVVNLAGAGIAEKRWTKERRRILSDSRLQTTRTLVAELAGQKGTTAAFVSASAIGFYGARGDTVLTEEAPCGTGFLATLCEAWETEALRAREAGIRTVVPRIGIVLAREGGALARLLPLYRFGLGGRLGDGSQWMSWIALDDLVAVLLSAIDDEALSGPINAVSPRPVRNREFSRALARALSRPAPWLVPSPVLRLLLGEMADETLLSSARVAPAKLEERGLRFRHPELGGALAALL